MVKINWYNDTMEVYNVSFGKSASRILSAIFMSRASRLFAKQFVCFFVELSCVLDNQASGKYFQRVSDEVQGYLTTKRIGQSMLVIKRNWYTKYIPETFLFTDYFYVIFIALFWEQNLRNITV